MRYLLTVASLLLLIGAPGRAEAAACVPVAATQACLQEVDNSSIGNRLPLILVHGWNPAQIPGPPMNASWSGLISYVTHDAALNAAYKLYSFTYYSNVVPVATLGRALRDTIEIQGGSDAAFQSRELVIVAHSMGGLVSRYFMTLSFQTGPFRGQPGGDRVRTLVTLGTPHHGSKFANGQAMRDRAGAGWGWALDLFFDWFYPNGPQWYELNRTDMFWDNFDGAFDYERFPSERNAFLDSLNRDARYDGKIIAYAGAIAPCESRFEVGYCLAATVLGGVFGDASDGVVSVSSALSYRSSQDQRTRFRASRYYPDYDHSQLAAGRGDNGLFSNLRTDLLATTGTQPANPSQSCQAVVIAVGSTVEGALTGADCGAPHRSGRPGDVYRLQLTAGQRIRISMDGGSLFDPYLLLVSPSGVVVAEDDDSGVLLDAAIDYVVAATGIYTIEASSYDADDRGTYTLRIVAAASTCTPASVSLNSRHAGALTDSDCVAPHRSAVRADVYQFNGQAGQRITIRMTGLTLGDPYLILVSGSTVIARDDDAGGGLDAFIQITLPSTGTYQIEATAYDDTERGTYQLDLTAGAGPASAVGGRSYGSSAAKKYGKELAEPR